MKLSTPLAVFFVASMTIPSAAAGATDPSEKKRFLVQTRPGFHRSLKVDISENAAGVNIVHAMEDLDILAVEVDGAHAEMALRENSNVLAIAEDHPRHLIDNDYDDFLVNDYDGGFCPLNIEDPFSLDIPVQKAPIGIRASQAPEVWSLGFRGQDVTVCVLDSGVDYNHEENLSGETFGNIFCGGEWFEDCIGHGTSMVGTIAAADNEIGTIGMAPEAKIFVSNPYSSDEGVTARVSDLMKSVQRCIDAGAKVINMSFSGEFNPFENNFFNKLLRDDDVLVIAASGNSGPDTTFYPAAYPHVVSVAGIDARTLEPWPVSSTNDQVDLASHGFGVLTTAPTDPYYYATCFGSSLKYMKFSGTSYSAAHVSGLAALLWSAQPDATAIEIRDAMYRSALDVGPEGKDEMTGHGFARALDALMYLLDEGDKNKNKNNVKK